MIQYPHVNEVAKLFKIIISKSNLGTYKKNDTTEMSDIYL